MPEASSGTHHHQLAGRVEDRLLGECGAELRGALRAQLGGEAAARSRADAQAEARLHEAVVDDLEGHVCGVCSHTMASAALSEDGLDHSPELLIPCGHNLCKFCVHEYCGKQGRKACPFCRARIEAHAPNRPLGQLVAKLLTMAAGICPGGDAAALSSRGSQVQEGAAESGAAEHEELGRRYAREWTSLHAQVRATELEQEELAGQLTAARARRGAAESCVAATEATCSDLEAQRQSARRSVERLAEQRLALEAKREGLQRRREEAQARQDTAKSLVESLRQEIAQR